MTTSMTASEFDRLDRVPFGKSPPSGTGKVFTVEMHHQRVDFANPGLEGWRVVKNIMVDGFLLGTRTRRTGLPAAFFLHVPSWVLLRQTRSQTPADFIPVRRRVTKSTKVVADTCITEGDPSYRCFRRNKAWDYESDTGCMLYFISVRHQMVTFFEGDALVTSSILLLVAMQLLLVVS